MIIKILRLSQEESYNRLCDIKDYQVKDIGTGFLISGNGYFITAGHVINENKKLEDYAVYEDILYKINKIKVDYESLLNQKPPRFLDFAIGKIEVENCNCFDIETFQKPIVEESVILRGFSRKSRKNPEDEPIISIEDLPFEEEIKSPIEEIYLDDLKGVCSKVSFIQSYKHLNGTTVGGEFSNGFHIKYDFLLTVSPGGISGCPILNANERIIGWLIRGNVKEGIGLIFEEKEIEAIKRLTISK